MLPQKYNFILAFLAHTTYLEACIGRTLVRHPRVTQECLN